MGKTTVLKYIAKPPGDVRDTRPQRIKDSGACGRILCVHAPDFTDMACLWGLVVVYHCCSMFAGCNVSGIEFCERSMQSLFDVRVKESGLTAMEAWCKSMLTAPEQKIFAELKRLTELAFDLETDPHIIVLVDECQVWSEEGKTRRSDLSIAMGRLPSHVRVAVAGTHDRRLDELSQNGTLYQVASAKDGALRVLSTLSALKVIGEPEGKTVLHEAARVIAALSGVPRILRIGRDVMQGQDGVTMVTTPLDCWIAAAKKYYRSSLESYSVDEACWIVAATTCRWIPRSDDDCVPGTQCKWKDLQEKGLVYREVDQQFSRRN